jgi:hypothetical protein
LKLSITEEEDEIKQNAKTIMTALASLSHHLIIKGKEGKKKKKTIDIHLHDPTYHHPVMYCPPPPKLTKYKHPFPFICSTKKTKGKKKK